MDADQATDLQSSRERSIFLSWKQKEFQRFVSYILEVKELSTLNGKMSNKFGKPNYFLHFFY